MDKNVLKLQRLLTHTGYNPGKIDGIMGKKTLAAYQTAIGYINIPTALVVKHKLNKRSLKCLKGIHPDLTRVIKKASLTSPVEFQITEGLRTRKRQKQLIARGVSWTMRSRHLTGHAVDLICIVNGKVSWAWQHYNKLGPFIERIAKEEGVSIKWGGRWKKTPDGPHFQLTWAKYPK